MIRKRLYDWAFNYILDVEASKNRYIAHLHPKCWLALLLFVVG